MRAFIRVMPLFLLLLISLMGSVSAHVVEQFFAEIHEDEESWEVEVLFDVGYASAESRGDPDALAPEYAWLRERTPEQYEELMRGSEDYLRECLEFLRGEEVMEVDYHFGDFDHEPPEFYQNLIDGAYFRVSITPRDDFEFEEVRCRVQEGLRPKFVFARTESGETTYFTASAGEEVSIAEGGVPSRWFIFQEGFRHVIPLGMDHILFIVALFLARRQGRFLLQQSLVFTFAHSLTLGVAAAGFLTVSAVWVEPLIALSIVFLAAENLCLAKSLRRRFFLIFLFGLLHGLGFAAVLQKYFAESESFLTHLALINLGVEIAQITILICAWILTIKWNQARGYRPFTMWMNWALIAIAGWWFFARI